LQELDHDAVVFEVPVGLAGPLDLAPDAVCDLAAGLAGMHVGAA
jgi:hypothetical protein